MAQGSTKKLAKYIVPKLGDGEDLVAATLVQYKGLNTNAGIVGAAIRAADKKAEPGAMFGLAESVPQDRPVIWAATDARIIFFKNRIGGVGDELRSFPLSDLVSFEAVRGRLKLGILQLVFRDESTIGLDIVNDRERDLINEASVLSGYSAKYFIESGIFAFRSTFLVSITNNGGISVARRGRPTIDIKLNADERKTLERWARRHTSSQALALRCRIVLACSQGRSDRDIANEVGVHPVTVSKWRHRFATDRLDGLMDAPRPGAKRTIADEVIEAVLVDTLESTPGEDTHWSTRGMAEKHGISRQTVSEIWRAFGLKPWQQGKFKLSPDPDLVEKIRDIVGIYMNPPVNAVVFAVDEKPQIQALNRTAPILPMMLTTAERATSSYLRNGTCDLFAALNIATGMVITDIRTTHTSDDFIAFLNKINRNVPKGLEVHIVLDNLSAHKSPKIHKWLLRHKRFHFHFTPTYGSWMNLVERWFSALTTKKLQRSAHRNVKELADDILAWAAAWNENPKPFVWHKTAEEILQRLADYCTALKGDDKLTPST